MARLFPCYNYKIYLLVIQVFLSYNIIVKDYLNKIGAEYAKLEYKIKASKNQ